MPGPPTQRDRTGIIALRRTMVSRLWIRGLSQREIQQALAHPEQGILNSSGGMWGLGTINRDIQAVKLEYQRQYASEYHQHVARMLAEYREGRREAWRQNDLGIILKFCVAECKLLGLDRPDRLELSWREEAEAAGVDAGEVFERIVASAAADLDRQGG